MQEKAYMDQAAEGRYEVYSNGRRIGLVLGGGRHWVAEVKSKHAGAYQTKKAAFEQVVSLSKKQETATIEDAWSALMSH